MTRNEAIYVERKRGTTFAEIGKRYGISKERVRQICIKEERKEMLKRGCTEWPLSDFAEYGQLGIRICNAIFRSGIKTKEELIGMVKSEKIARVRNIGAYSVYTICKRYDIPMPEYLKKSYVYRAMIEGGAK
jgi:hypothetical protein